MWEFISGIKPPQKRKTDEYKNSYYKYLKSLLVQYLIKWVFKMNNYSFMSECFDFSFSSTEKLNWALKNLAGPLEIRS